MLGEPPNRPALPVKFEKLISIKMSTGPTDSGTPTSGRLEARLRSFNQAVPLLFSDPGKDRDQ